MPYTMKFIVMVCAAFFARVKPVSTSAKPACMNITRKPATSVQTKLMATVLASMSPSVVYAVSVDSYIICTFLRTLCNTLPTTSTMCVWLFLHYVHECADTMPGGEGARIGGGGREEGCDV